MDIHFFVRWMARGLGVVIFLLILAFAFGGQESMSPTRSEMVGLLFFPVGVLIGFALSWRWEGWGSLFSIVSLACFYGWLYVRDGSLDAGPYFLWFSLPAFLHAFNALAKGLRNPSHSVRNGSAA